jgi:transcriptional regulator with XRE-family HTH domain
MHPTLANEEVEIRRTRRRARREAIAVTSGERIRALRHDSGHSLRSACQHMGIPETTLGALERGTLLMRIHDLFTISQFYGVSMEWIVQGGSLKRPLKTPLQKFNENMMRASERRALGN